MMEKIKEKLLDIGQVIATLLIFFPVFISVIACFYNKLNTKEWYIAMIISILYSAYFYKRVLNRGENIEKFKEHILATERLNKEILKDTSDKEKYENLLEQVKNFLDENTK